MSRTRARGGLVVLCALAVAGGCVGGAAGDKGEEEAAPMDGRFDSFFEPTNHGPLSFGLPSRAAFTDEEHFHSWTFTLDAEAEVDLSTIIGSNNVDTVMYLYSRASETEAWGAYVARNDDDGDLLSSRIQQVLGAGQYKIVIKAHKLAVRGAFEVLANCDGEGCGATGVACDADDPEPLPPSTPFTAACARRLRGVYDSGVIHSDEYGIDASERCTVSDDLERLAIGYYRAYWNDLMGWEDFVYDPEDGVALYVQSMALDGYQTGGTVVGVDLEGGDESAIDFVFDLEGNLLALYQHNQSPDVIWFCGDDDEPESSDAPDEDCLQAYMSSMPHDDDEVGEEDHDGAIGALAEAVGGTTSMALETYIERRGVARDADVEVTVLSWESSRWGNGGQVTINAEGQPTITYDVSDDSWGSAQVVMEVNHDDDAIRFVCAE